MEKNCRRANDPSCRPIRVPLATPMTRMKTMDAILSGLNIQSKNVMIEQKEIPNDWDTTKFVTKDSVVMPVKVRKAAIKAEMRMV